MVEFFNRLHLTENLKFIDFANDNGMIIKQFTDAIDSSYELGQRYGQTTRIVKSPYRISDLEYYLNKQDVQSLNRIANYTQIYLNEPLPFELIFAKQMGFNVATLMNSGWITSNMLHMSGINNELKKHDKKMKRIVTKVLEYKGNIGCEYDEKEQNITVLLTNNIN